MTQYASRHSSSFSTVENPSSKVMNHFGVVFFDTRINSCEYAPLRPTCHRQLGLSQEWRNDRPLVASPHMHVRRSLREVVYRSWAKTSGTNRLFEARCVNTFGLVLSCALQAHFSVDRSCRETSNLRAAFKQMWCSCNCVATPVRRSSQIRSLRHFCVATFR